MRRIDASAPARQAAALFTACGALAWLAALLPGPDRGGLVLIGLADVLAAAAAWLLPWRRWPAWATLALTVPAFAVIAAANAAGLIPPRTQSALFILTFVWVGAGHRRWSSLWVAPLAALAYTVSALSRPYGIPLDPQAVVMVTAVCVLVAETVAVGQQRVHQANADLQFLAEHTTDLVTRIGTDGVIAYVSPSVHSMLGWTPQDLLGRHVEAFCHPDDAPLPAAASAPAGRPVTMIRRLRRADGGYTWCEAVARTLTGPAGRQEILCSARDITARRAAEAELAHRASHDPLTGLPNRSVLTETLTAALAAPAAQPLTVAFIDLDGFKAINDTHGHQVGDRLLAQLARRLQHTCREQDTVARYGGDEFVLLLHALAPQHLPALLERLRAELGKPYLLGPLTLHVGASIGAVTAGPYTTAEQLIAAADQAMYATKHAGRTRPAEPGPGGLPSPAPETRPPARTRPGANPLPPLTANGG